MSYESILYEMTLPAGQDLSSSQFCAVAVNTSAQAALPSAGVNIVGFVQNKPTSGQATEVRVHGITKAKVGTGGVTVGDALKVDASGQVVTASAGNKCVGFALQTAAAGTLTSCLLKDFTI